MKNVRGSDRIRVNPRQSNEPAARPEAGAIVVQDGTVDDLVAQMFPDGVPPGAKRFVVAFVLDRYGTLPEPGSRIPVPPLDEVLDIGSKVKPAVLEAAGRIAGEKGALTLISALRKQVAADLGKLSPGTAGPATAPGPAMPGAGAGASLRGRGRGRKQARRPGADGLRDSLAGLPSAPTAGERARDIAKKVGKQALGSLAGNAAGKLVKGTAEKLARPLSEGAKAVLEEIVETATGEAVARGIDAAENAIGGALAGGGPELRASRAAAPPAASRAQLAAVESAVRSVASHALAVDSATRQQLATGLISPPVFGARPKLPLEQLRGVTPAELRAATQRAFEATGVDAKHAADAAEDFAKNLEHGAGAAFLTTVRLHANGVLAAAVESISKVLHDPKEMQMLLDAVGGADGQGRAAFEKMLGARFAGVPSRAQVRAALERTRGHYQHLIREAMVKTTTAGAEALIEKLGWAMPEAAERYGLRLTENGIDTQDSVIGRGVESQVGYGRLLRRMFQATAAVATSTFSVGQLAAGGPAALLLSMTESNVVNVLSWTAEALQD